MAKFIKLHGNGEEFYLNTDWIMTFHRGVKNTVIKYAVPAEYETVNGEVSRTGVFRYSDRVDETPEEIINLINDKPKGNLLTINQTAKRLNITRVTLYRWAKDGKLTPILVNNAKRYRESDVDKLMNE